MAKTGRKPKDEYFWIAEIASPCTKIGWKFKTIQTTSMANEQDKLITRQESQQTTAKAQRTK